MVMDRKHRARAIISSGEYAYAIQMLNDHAAEARRQERGAACRAICIHCRRGSKAFPPSESEPFYPYWTHEGASVPRRVPCEAHSIHALPEIKQ